MGLFNLHRCLRQVKSENDRLSDKQRLWIHVLSGAGVKVELCAAVAKENTKNGRVDKQ